MLHRVGGGGEMVHRAERFGEVVLVGEQAIEQRAARFSVRNVSTAVRTFGHA